MPTHLPPNDANGYLAMLEQAQQEARADFIELHVPKLTALIAKMQDGAYELADAQQRARTIVLKHEPPASKRLRPKPG